MRRAISRAVLLLVSVTLGGLLAELGFRYLVLSPLVPTSQQEFMHRVASTWPHPVLPTKEDHRIRILGLADSFGVKGGGANYHYLLGEQLSPDLNVEMINFAMGGAQPTEELLLLKRFGASYQPDLVLHGVFVGNDFGSTTGTMLSFHYIFVHTPDLHARWMPSDWLIWQWFREYRTVLKERWRRSHEPTGSSGSFSRESFLSIERSRMDVFRKDLRDYLSRSETLAVLDAIEEESTRMGAQYVLLIHPDQLQVEASLQRELVDRYHLNVSDYDFDQPQAILRDHASSRRIPYVDLLPEFRQQGSGGGLFLPRDTHYNIRGNRLTAEIIARKMPEIIPTIPARRY